MSCLPRARFALLAFLVPIVGAPAARAEPSSNVPPRAAASPRAIALDDAIAYGRDHQPGIRAALARVAARESAADVPRAQWQPTLGITAQLLGGTTNNTTGSYVSPSYLDVPRIGGTRAVATGSWQPYPSTFAAVGGNQELFDFGRIAAQAAAADALVDMEKQRARVATLDLTFNVQEAYFAVFAAKSIVKSSEDAYERSRVHRDLAKAGVDAGLRSPIEITRAEADLARFDISRIKARGGLAVAQMVLAAAIGAPDSALDVTDSPPSQGDMPALNTAIQEASAHDPRIQEALARLRAEEQRTRAIGAELRPDLSLTGTLSARAGGADPSSGVAANGGGWIPNVPNWNAGVIFNWPLFDGTVRARERASQAEEQVRREEIAQARYEQVARIQVAFGGFQVARAALPGLQHAVVAAQANYAQADARFRAGLGTSVELADAEALRTDAEVQLALGTFDIARTRAAFGRAIAEGL